MNNVRIGDQSMTGAVEKTIEEDLEGVVSSIEGSETVKQAQQLCDELIGDIAVPPDTVQKW